MDPRQLDLRAAGGPAPAAAGATALKVRSGRLAGQWGMSHDDFGRLFFSYNQDHIRGSLVPTVYATRNPHYTASAGVDVRIGMDNDVWPHAITPGVNRRAQLRDDGRLAVFTANSAPTVYRGDQFPEEYRGNVFVGESAGRLIRRSVLTERDGIITGKNAYAEREFLFSHDERFRPVFSATGPDGALYVADMYRGIIEGHIFLTTFLRNQIVDRGLHQPFHGMGRIYRIVHEGQPLGTPPAIATRERRRVGARSCASQRPLARHGAANARRVALEVGRAGGACAGDVARGRARPPARVVDAGGARWRRRRPGARAVGGRIAARAYRRVAHRGGTPRGSRHATRGAGIGRRQGRVRPSAGALHARGVDDG